MNRIVHMGLWVRGALRNGAWRHELLDCITTGEGKKLATAGEVHDFLCDQLAMGHEMLPFGECDAWDWITGCPGHNEEPKQ